MNTIEKFKKEVLKSYLIDNISSVQRNNLHKKINRFNKKNGTHFWVDSKKQGESHNWTVINIRNGGESGKVIYIRNFRTKLKDIFKDYLERIRGEMNQPQVLSQKNLDGLQLKFNF